MLALALATSRLGLLAHELVGHGGTAVACGGTLTKVQLFWFAGGWVRYQFPPGAAPSMAAEIAISMGGIAIELVTGTALWLAVRGDGLGRRLIRGTGIALVVHASWYFATGVWKGYGDGQLLHQVLGSARYPAALAAGAITCAAGYLGARTTIGPLRATQVSLAGLIVAVALAGGIHAGLSIGELELRRDTVYTSMMVSANERSIERDLRTWAAYEAAHGGEVTPQQRAAEHARLEQVHRAFPFTWVLAACAVLAILAGAWRSVRNTPAGAPLATALLVRAASTAAIAIATVIAIDWLTR